MNTNNYDSNEIEIENKNEDSKRDTIIRKIEVLQNSEAFSKLTDTARNIVSIIIYTAMFITSWSFYNINIKDSTEATFARISFYIFFLVTITFVAGIVKSAVSLYLSHILEKKLNIYNCTDDELAFNEKTAKLILAVCDLLNAFIPNLFAIIIGGGFTIAGVYFGLFAGENSQLAFLFVFPLMGLGAIIAATLPTIRSIKSIIAIKNDIEYIESKNNFNEKRILTIISGLIFAISGIICIATGISNFATDKEMIDKIGFILFGIPFCAIGTFLIITNDKFN